MSLKSIDEPVKLKRFDGEICCPDIVHENLQIVRNAYKNACAAGHIVINPNTNLPKKVCSAECKCMPNIRDMK